MKITAAWSVLGRRQVIRYALGYVAAAWILYEVVSLIGQNFAWPAVIVRVLTIVIACGFLATLVIAWHHGEGGNQPVSSMEVLQLVAIAVIGVLAGWKVEQHARAPALTPENEPSVRIDSRSVAVLPFIDLSPGHDHEYLADGLTTELIQLLGQVPGMRVPGPTSSFYFKGRSVPLSDIAKQLRVAHVLEGSVRQSGSDIHVTAQLTNALTGRQLWSRSLDANSGEIMELQRDIARSILFDLALSSFDFPSQERRDSETHDLYLQGLLAFRSSPITPASNSALVRAIELFRRAVDQDARYAEAWAGLARAYGRAGEFPKAKVAALEAIAIDSTIAMGHLSLGYALAWGEWRWAEGERELSRAIELSPSSPDGYLSRATVRFVLGRFDEAFTDHERGEVLDPLALTGVANRGLLLVKAGRYAEAVRAFQQLPFDTQKVFRNDLAAALIGVGRRTDAVAVLLAVGDSARATVARGDVDEIKTVIRRIEAGVSCAPWEYYMAVGMRDRVLDCLELSVRKHERFVPLDLRDARLAPLRPDPRFQQLLREVGLPLE